MLKHLRSHADSEAAGAPPTKVPRREAAVAVIEELGSGSPRDPFYLPLREKPNRSGCWHCPSSSPSSAATSSSCECQWMDQVLTACYSSLAAKREVVTYQKSELCAKSILPPFVSRLVRLAQLQEGEVFYDLGCGNGSVLFQVALMTGARCVGVEINPVNAKVAQDAWAKLKPVLEKRCGRELHVEIICGDFCKMMKEDGDLFAKHSNVIWAANLLLPKPVNHYLSERLRTVASGTRIFCFEDLFPHSRSIAAIRDPDAFARFEMLDYKWQPSSVEWCDLEGAFYQYTRR